MENTKFDKMIMEALTTGKFSVPYDECIEECCKCVKFGYKKAIDDVLTWIKENFYEWSGYYQGEDFVVHNSCETVNDLCDTFLKDIMED